MSRPAAAVMAAAGLRLQLCAPCASLEFGAVCPPEHGGPAGFAAALAEAGRQLTGDVRVVVVTGATWHHAWSAPAEPDVGASTWLSGRPDLFSVAVLHGEVSGLGLGLALACDLRVAADDTRLTWRGAAADGPPSAGAAADLVAAVGYAPALEWSVVGATVVADRAAELGLLTRLAPPAAVSAAAASLVDALLAVPRERAVETKARLLAGRRCAGYGR